MMSEKKLLTMFMEKMATDEEFAAKVAGLQTPEDLMELAKKLDVELSQEQARNGLAQIKKLGQEDSMLEDDALEDIAGGEMACQCS